MKTPGLCVFRFAVALLLLAAGAPPARAEEAKPSLVPPAETTFKDPFSTEPSSSQPAAKVSDPLESVNRFLFRVNDKFYFWGLKPAAQGYGKITPLPIRSGVSHFFANVKYPIRFVHNLLEGRFKAARIETERFLLNSTIGLGGLMDPARQELKLETQPADFDQTLGVYGIAPGPFLELPVLGPCSARGAVGLAGDTMLSPWTYSDTWTVSFGVPAFDVLNAASLRIGDYESLKSAAVDPYIAFRDAYFEYRRGLVNK